MKPQLFFQKLPGSPTGSCFNGEFSPEAVDGVQAWELHPSTRVLASSTKAWWRGKCTGGGRGYVGENRPGAAPKALEEAPSPF